MKLVNLANGKEEFAHNQRDITRRCLESPDLTAEMYGDGPETWVLRDPNLKAIRGIFGRRCSECGCRIRGIHHFIGSHHKTRAKK